MRFEWDEAKRQTNLQKHGLDLLLGATLFGEAQVYTIHRHDAARHGM
jgi:uncharacterized DUF497 family protein